MPATRLFISGVKGKPQVILNGLDVSAVLQPAQEAGVDGWHLPLAENSRQ